MATRTYLYGYPVNGEEKRVTLDELNKKWTWVNFHPEMQRRIVRMMDDCQDAGHDAGVGQAARSTIAQEQAFYARHTRVSSGGCCIYKGYRYKLKPGMAHAAKPGSSAHEDELYEGYALAIDMRGWESHWMDQNCSRYGLKNFGGAYGPTVNGEEWHFQPVEFGNSRSTILVQISQGIRLQKWPLPGDYIPPEPAPKPPPTTDNPPPIIQEEDAMIVLVIKDVRAPYAVWKSNGVVKSWVRDGDASLEIEKRIAESANGTKPSPWDGFTYKEFKHSGNDVIATYGPIMGPKPDGFDDYGRLL